MSRWEEYGEYSNTGYSVTLPPPDFLPYTPLPDEPNTKPTLNTEPPTNAETISKPSTSSEPSASDTRAKRRLRTTSREKMQANMRNYPLLPPCNCKYKKCSEKFTQPEREEIHQMFWKMSDLCRKVWIYTHIKPVPVKRSAEQTVSGNNRACARHYFLDTPGGVSHNICQKFFLSTLGYRNDKVISHTLSSFTKDSEKMGSLVSSMLTKAKRRKKRPPVVVSRGEQQCKSNVDKRRSSQLTEYELLSRNLEKYPLLDSCACKRNCGDAISEARRRSIHLQYWCLSYGHRKQWLFHSIKTEPVKQNSAKRSCMRHYFLTNAEGQPAQICRKFFLSTLGYTNDKIIVHTLSTVDGDTSTLPVSLRGKHAPAHALKPATVSAMQEHIHANFPKNTSVRHLHEKYLLANPDMKVSYEAYRGMLDRLKGSKTEIIEPAVPCIEEENT